MFRAMAAGRVVALGGKDVDAKGNAGAKGVVGVLGGLAAGFCTLGVVGSAIRLNSRPKSDTGPSDSVESCPKTFDQNLQFQSSDRGPTICLSLSVLCTPLQLPRLVVVEGAVADEVQIKTE